VRTEKIEAIASIFFIVGFVSGTFGYPIGIKQTTRLIPK